MIKSAALVASVSRRAGGLFESVRRLNQEVAATGEATVDVLSLEDEFTEDDLSEWQPITPKAFRVRGPRAFGYAPGYARELLGRGFDIVHLHGIWMYPSLACGLWHRASQRPYVVSAHGMLDGWALRNSWAKKRLALLAYEGRTLRSAACIRTLASEETDALRRLGLRNPICQLPNGVDLPDGRQTAAPWRGLVDREARVLLFLGRLHPKKQLPLLLHGWRQVRSGAAGGIKNWRLAIVGWGDARYVRELQQQVAEVSKNDILFLGPRFGAERSGAYAHASAFVLPSVSEGVPMAVLEAWAHGLPVLMTPACNLPQGFVRGAAIRIEPSADSIAAGLADLVALDDAALIAMGQKGKRLVAEEYEWRTIGKEMVRVYSWILGTGDRPECIR